MNTLKRQGDQFNGFQKFSAESDVGGNRLQEGIQFCIVDGNVLIHQAIDQFIRDIKPFIRCLLHAVIVHAHRCNLVIRSGHKRKKAFITLFFGEYGVDYGRFVSGRNHLCNGIFAGMNELANNTPFSLLCCYRF